MNKKILLTRPRRSSERWAGLLARHGFDSVIEPLLTIVATGAPRPPGRFQAVIITSASVAEVLAGGQESIADLLHLPCYCVGGATGDAARGLGFTDVASGASDGAALAQTICAKQKTGSPILHIAGDVVDDKAQDILVREGFALSLWPVYRAGSAEDFGAGVKKLWAAGEIAAAPVFSPRSARILVSMIEKNHLTPACHAVTAIGLSQAVADVLQALPWRRLMVAATPCEEDMLACLQSEDFMSEPAPPLLPPETRTPPRREPAGASARIILGVLVTAGAVVAAWQCPWLQTAFRTDAMSATNAAPPGDIAELRLRVHILETRFDTMTETAGVAAAPAAQTIGGNAAGENELKKLRDELAQMKASTASTVAAALALMDVREQADRGKSFGDALARLQKAAAGDTATLALVGALTPYADNVPPTCAQLREMLAAGADSIAAPAGSGAGDWQERARAVMRHLISVHPLRNPALAPLEKALDDGDGAAALQDFQALPVETQNSLTEWHEKLRKRTALDTALQELTAHLETGGGAP